MANFTLQIAQMTVSEFKAFKKSLATLYRAGINNEDAIEILVPKMLMNREMRQNQRIAEAASYKRFGG